MGLAAGDGQRETINNLLTLMKTNPETQLDEYPPSVLHKPGIDNTVAATIPVAPSDRLQVREI